MSEHCGMVPALTQFQVLTTPDSTAATAARMVGIVLYTRVAALLTVVQFE